MIFLSLFILQNKKKEESFDLREMQQIIRELTVGINVFEELPAISLRPRYDKGEIKHSKYLRFLFLLKTNIAIKNFKTKLSASW